MGRRLVLTSLLVTIWTGSCTIVDTFGPLVAELDVYAVAVEEACPECDRRPYGVADATVDMRTLMGSERDQNEYTQLLRESFPTLLAATLDDFVRQNEAAYPRSEGDYHSLQGMPEVVSSKVFERLRDKRASCGEQCGKLASSHQSLFRFSSAGFNSEQVDEQRQALLYMEQYCGDSCGQARLVLLAKDGNEWAVEQVLDVWSF